MVYLETYSFPLCVKLLLHNVSNVCFSSFFLESCKAPKKYVSCSESLENKYGAACAPTCQMLATGIECVSFIALGYLSS